MTDNITTITSLTHVDKTKSQTDFTQILKNNLLFIYEAWLQDHLTHTNYDSSLPLISYETLPSTFCLSMSDGMKRAKTFSFNVEGLIETDVTNDTIEFHVKNGSENYSYFQTIIAKINLIINKLSSKFDNPITWLRIEWLNQATSTTWKALEESLKKYKRYYFRSGIAIKGVREPWLLMTEMELNANACLYVSNKVAHAGVNYKNLNTYIKARHGSSQLPNYSEDLPTLTFNTVGVFIDVENHQVFKLETEPRFKGRRTLMPLSPNNISPFVEKSSIFLSNQVQSEGRYIYGYFPCFDRQISFYNSLRHASSTYALIEGYEATRHFSSLTGEKRDIHLKGIHQLGDLPNASSLKVEHAKQLEQMQRSIDKALNYLLTELTTVYGDKAYIIDTGGEIKLGANAVAILAIVKYLQVFKDTKLQKVKSFEEIAEKLALGILDMQKNDGGFVHVLYEKNLEVKEESRIIYYDGEAAFALMRLYGMTKDERWLNCVVKAFDYFIEAEHYQAHDHWLSYCSNELVIYRPEKKYFQFAVDNIKGYTDFIKNRLTTFPTLLELSMAFHKMLLKLDDHPEFYDVLQGLDLQDFYQALHTRANYLINGFFFPEVAMFFKAPHTILHGFFIRHHSLRVRIDDVEHYLSGLIAYDDMLKEGVYPKLCQITQSVDPEISGRVLTASAVLKATGGQWIVLPKEEWYATGLCIWAPSFKPSQMIVARGNKKRGYLPHDVIENLIRKGASAVITDNPESFQTLNKVTDKSLPNLPILKVSNLKKAAIDIGRYARQSFNGHVVGVTGSAGKTTTVGMLAHTLSQFGGASFTKASANLPQGIAWNLASMNQDDEFWILEMAIGSMETNSDLVRPNVAILTNIAPAHLKFHKTLESVTLKKSRIFYGMLPGSTAVLCRDIEQYDIIAQIAKVRGINIVSYGEHSEAMIKLLQYGQDSNSAQAQTKILIKDRIYNLDIKSRGKHMVLNALAVLAVVDCYELSIEDAITQLENFKAVTGRGNVIEMVYQGKQISIHNEAYNANPLSMQVVLESFDQLEVPAFNKLLILGDMLELGDESQRYHLELAEVIKTIDCRQIVVVGKHSLDIANELKDSDKIVSYFEDSQSLAKTLGDFVQDDDTILIKASNGIGLGRLF